MDIIAEQHKLNLNHNALNFEVFLLEKEMTALIPKGEQAPELIVCAAIKFELMGMHYKDGMKPNYYIVTGIRHYDQLMRMSLDVLNDYYTAKKIEQGFVTNKNRFVSRKEALEIAKANNQIRCDIGYEPKELYSEMLY